MLQAAIQQRTINPPPGVELTGWGYYLERTWNDIRDDLQATALIVSDETATVIVISLDLMVIDRPFAERVRQGISQRTGVAESAILICCTHTHNAPAAGGLLGVGVCDPAYEVFAADRAIEAAFSAWQQQQPVRCRCATSAVPGLTFNRTRPNGQVDDSLVSLLLETAAGMPVAVVVNYAAHPTIATETFPYSLSRDVPGAVCGRLEECFAGATAMYLQGACGDTNFRPKFKVPQRQHEPADAIANEVRQSLQTAEPATASSVNYKTARVALPVRRWTHEEIIADRQEALSRLQNADFDDWERSIGRSMTNRPADMVERHGGDEQKAVRAMCRFQVEWTDRMLADMEARPEHLMTEVQALRLGPLTIVANGCEFFAPFAQQLRAAQRGTNGTANKWTGEAEHLMVACYANDRIGYLPDAYDIAAKSYAAWQSPKYCNQFPFVDESGQVMTDAMLQTARAVAADIRVD